MRKILALVLLLALAGCGGSPQAVQPTAPLATRENASEGPTAAPAPTAVSLADLDLESLLVQNGDLPAGVSGAQIRDTAPEMPPKMPKTTKTVYQQLAVGNAEIGGVSVFLYEETADRDAAMAALTELIDPSGPINGIGEQAVTNKASAAAGVMGRLTTDVIFRRCAAIVQISLDNQRYDQATVASYAKRLDKRLAGVVC